MDVHHCLLMDDFWVLGRMFPSDCWGTKVQFLSWCQLTEEGSVFQQEHPQFCKPLAHTSSPAAPWNWGFTGQNQRGIYWETYLLRSSAPVSAMGRVRVWGHCSAPHQGSALLLGQGMAPEISSMLRRGAAAKAGAVPDLGHCSAGGWAEFYGTLQILHQ